VTDEQQRIIDTLRSQGYAIALFTPDELGVADAADMEDMMVEAGNSYIVHCAEETG
jgi:hypothetical protein